MKANPYVGPRSFITGEKLYGRDRELRRLANLLIAERIVLLYSPSGAGKTSLVQAALVPRLIEEGFQVLPPIRVGAEPPSEFAGVNRYVLSTMLSIEGRRPTKDQIPLAELAGLSLDVYLERITDPALDGCVLIFDQFEEMLSLAPNDRAAKEEFFTQVGAALRSRQHWGLFSMREDYIAQLDPFLREIPTRLANRMRLDLLDVESALTAIQKPAQAAKVTFVKEAAQQLIDDLRMVRSQLADGSTQQELGLYVEPVQLQVVCYRLWSGLPEDDFEISVNDVAQIGDVTTALRSYYAERVAAAAQIAGVNERLVRDWCDNQLITAQGLRGQVLRERGSSGGLLNSAINALIDSHLVRGEPIRGAIWYELTHDRLIGPIQADNAAWRTAHLSPLQHQAALWESQNRQDGLLLRDAALDNAELWAAEHLSELTEVEHTFLARCREVRRIIARERRKNQIIQGLAIVSSVVGVLALILAVLAFSAKRSADALASRSQVQALASNALTDSLARPQLSLLLALQAQQIGASYDLLQGEEALQQILSRVGGQPTALTLNPSDVAFSADGTWLALYGPPRATEGAVAQLVVQATAGQAEPTQLVVPDGVGLSNIVLSPDGALLAATTTTGDLLVWRRASPQDAPQLVQSSLGDNAPLGFSPDSSLLVAGDASGRAFIWDRDAPSHDARMLSCEDLQQPFTALAISPDKKILIIGYRTGDVRRMTLTEPLQQCAIVPFHQHQEQVMALAFSPTGNLLVSGSSDSEVLVSSLASDGEKNAFHNHSSAITSLHFSADGTQIISSSRDGTAQIWQPFDPDKAAFVLRGHEGWVIGASFNLDHTEALSVGRDGALRRWNVVHPAATSVIHQHQREVASVVYSRDGRWLAVGSIDATASLWAVAGSDVRYTATISATSSIWSLAFNPDSTLLATASEDGKVRLWNPDAPQSALQVINAHADQTVTAVAFSPDSQILASVGYDGAVRLWDISQPDNPQQRGEWISAQPLQAVAFSEDGRLAVAGEAGVITVWDSYDLTESPEQLGEGVGYGPIYALAFRPGHPGQLAAAGFHAAIWIWDLAGPARIRYTFTGHNDWIIGVAFSSDGNRMASASNDDTVRVWQPELNDDTVRSTQPVQGESTSLVLRGHNADVETVSFSPDGKWLASGSLDNKVIIWPLDLATLQARACATAGRSLTSAEIKAYNLNPHSKICTVP